MSCYKCKGHTVKQCKLSMFYPSKIKAFLTLTLTLNTVSKV